MVLSKEYQNVSKEYKNVYSTCITEADKNSYLLGMFYK